MKETVTPDANVLTGYMAAFKNHLRLTGDEMDADLRQILLAAFRSAEHTIGRVIPVSSVVVAGSFSCSDLFVRRLRGPVIALDSVTVDGIDVTSGCVLKENTITVMGTYNDAELEIRYTAGWPDIPADLLNAVFLIGSSLFANPLDSVETLPKASSILLRPYRHWGEE